MPQLNLFEEFIAVEALQNDDQLRLAPDSPNIYVVVQQFYDAHQETKIKLLGAKQIYFVKHGRMVLKVKYHVEHKL